MRRLALLFVYFWVLRCGFAYGTEPGGKTTTLQELTAQLKAQVKPLGATVGMKRAFESFQQRHKLRSGEISYDDFILIRMLFETNRDAGLWNLRWVITDLEPNSKSIWRQWQGIAGKPTYTTPTAVAECDELSALFSFLARKTGIKSTGLFWPASNHTVSVWVIPRRTDPPIRVVVPTTQIFLDETDMFDTTTFNPWTQRNIYEYAGQDVPDSYTIPSTLVQFFIRQIETYTGATDDTLQRIRYLRESVFCGLDSPQGAASKAKALSTNGHLPEEDGSALRQFAEDLTRP